MRARSSRSWTSRSSRCDSTPIVRAASAGSNAPSARPSAQPRIAVSGVFSSWLTESRNARSASRDARSCSAISLNARASVGELERPRLGQRLVLLGGGDAAGGVGDATDRPADRAGDDQRQQRRRARPRRRPTSRRSRRNGSPGRATSWRGSEAAGRGPAACGTSRARAAPRYVVVPSLERFTSGTYGRSSARGCDDEPHAAGELVLGLVADRLAPLQRESVGARRERRGVRAVDLAAGQNRADRRSSGQV